ncbi:MAG: hypothetical protein N2511_06885, partial [Thermodesulfovibrionales bacterium]|nr:hypothetical protein [Thermodesulfovibrionales bacterium]
RQVISNMSDEKFRTIIAEEFKDFVDFEDEDEDENDVDKIDFIKNDDSDDDSVVYTYWNREASELVQQSLLREIVGMDKPVCCDTGRHLTEEQIPDGTHKGIPEKPDTLTKKQTPDISKSIKSNMVDKSRGEIRKDAKEKVEEEQNYKEVPIGEVKKDSGKKECKEANDSRTISFDGIELESSLDELELTPSELDEISNLFN